MDPTALSISASKITKFTILTNISPEKVSLIRKFLLDKSEDP